MFVFGGTLNPTCDQKPDLQGFYRGSVTLRLIGRRVTKRRATPQVRMGVPLSPCTDNFWYFCILFRPITIYCYQAITMHLTVTQTE